MISFLISFNLITMRNDTFLAILLRINGPVVSRERDNC